MKTTFFGITFAAFQYVFSLPLLVLAIALLVWRFVRSRRAIQLLATSNRSISLLRNTSTTKHAIKFLLQSIGLCFLFVSLLRPQWNKKEEIINQHGRDLFIAFDISRSMLVQDCKPSRLAFAKEKIRSLLNLLECERVGLILFSGSTCVQCPLTDDYGAFFMFLNQLDVETISSGTTAIDQAIKKALTTFKSMPTKKNKLLVLLTDGEDFSRNLAGVRSEAAKEGLTIFALGVGTPEGGPIPLFDEKGELIGHQKDKEEKIIISRLNEGILHNLAQQTGGTYIRLSPEKDDIEKLVHKVEQFEKEQFQDKKISLLEEKYPYFLAVSFICFVLEWLL